MVQRRHLEAITRERSILDDDATLRRLYRFFTLNDNPGQRILESFSLDTSKAERARRTSGFFAITMHKLDLSAMETFRAYCLRDEQEKCFQQIKNQMVAGRQRTWSEEGKTGRLFILFVALIISSCVRHARKSMPLHDRFSSSLAILDEMHAIRCIEYSNRAKFITPFVGAHLEICTAWGFAVPHGVPPDYVSRHKLPTREAARERNSSRGIYSTKGARLTRMSFDAVCTINSHRIL